MSSNHPNPTRRGRTPGKVGRPRKGNELRKRYSFRAPPSLVERAMRKAGGDLTDAVNRSLVSWLQD